MSLEDARGKAAECRALLTRKQDPIAVRDEQERAKRLQEARALTFDACAAAYIKAHRAGWKNAKHAAQWESTLATYVSPAFMVELRKRSGTAARALEFIILTGARVSEATLARWSEINTRTRVWTVPAERMKAKRAHRVPLSDAAMKVLGGMKGQNDMFVFPGWRVNRPITGAACLKLLRDMGYPELTVHGFRSTFRDWAAEQTNYPREVAESALAHVIADKIEAAYRRGDLFAKRARMMQDWGRYCAKTRTASVTPIRKRAKH